MCYLSIFNLTYQVFRLIKACNQKPGKLAFSTEHYDGDDFILEKSGRFAHSKKIYRTPIQEIWFNYRFSNCIFKERWQPTNKRSLIFY